MAFRFNGTNQWIDLGRNLPWLNGSAQATAMAWIRPQKTLTGIVGFVSISIGPPPGTSNARRFSLEGTTNNALRANVRSLNADVGVSVNSGTNVFNTGVWSHVAISYICVDRLINFYVNGRLVGSAFTGGGVSAVPFSATNVKNGSIGSQALGGTAFFTGDIEDARLYSRAMSDVELSTISAGFGADAIYDSLQFRYLLNEQGSGTPATIPSIAKFSRIEITPQNSPIYIPGVVRGRHRQVRNCIVQT
jgi:hypothetical protein